MSRLLQALTVLTLSCSDMRKHVSSDTCKSISVQICCAHVQDVKRHDDPDLVVLATDECLFADEGFRLVKWSLLLTETAVDALAGS